ncbi:MAG: hypothetical protein Q8L78_00590 [Coxiellaceae bacterium]|nr:hypothetical protein [Coxiellaceae bacterium]
MLKNSALKRCDYFFIFLLFFIAILIQQYSFFNWDASWHLLGAKRLLAGHASYTNNLFDDNLPMVFWFFIPAVFIHHYTDINLLFLCNLSINVLIFFSFLLCYFFLNIIYEGKTLLEKRLVLYGLLAILLIGPGYEFAQRDSLVTTFLFPYIALIGAQIKKGNTKNTIVRIIVGLFAAIGIAMNPFYGLLIAVLEGQRAFYQKKICIATPELLSFIGCVVLYLAIMVIFYHDYFTTIIPAFVIFCAVYNSPLIYLLLCSCALLFYITSIVFFIHFSCAKNPWFFSVWLGTFSSFIIFLMHQKLWESHAMPVFLMTSLLLLMLIVDMSLHKKCRQPFLLGISITVFFSCVVFSLYYHFYCYRLFQDKNSNTNQLIKFFNAQPKNTSLYLFSYELVNTFSFLPYTTVNYLPAGPSLWMMVHINAPSPWTLNQQALQQKRIVSDFQYKKPDFVLVDISTESQKLLPNFIGTLEKNEAFKQAWRRYHIVKRIGSYDIYSR